MKTVPGSRSLCMYGNWELTQFQGTARNVPGNHRRTQTRRNNITMTEALRLLIEAHLARAAEAWADDDYDRAHEWLGAAYAIAGEHSTKGGVR